MDLHHLLLAGLPAHHKKSDTPIIYSLVESCKLNRIDPQRYLPYVLERIADHPINRIEELLPRNVADRLNQPDQVTQALAA